MKKFLLLAFALLSINLIYATTYNVDVSNFQFSPATVNASVGDTIQWTWVSGFHTTTSTSVPAGANAWDAPMTSSDPSFKYKLTVAGTYSYFCSVHPNMIGTINVSSVLPVTLSAFSVTATGKDASILWRTANEQNVAFYTIKRSNDGTNFTNIGQVQATNSSDIHTYSFTDKTVSPGDKYLYYYIDVVDKDGSHTSSAIQSFKNIFAKTGLLRQVMPNPVNGTDHLMLQFYADKPGKMLTQLYDAKGTLIKQSEMAATTGINNAHFHTGALAAGTYVLRCTMDGKRETRQIVVQ
ncbi:T9SS type A sorting domain-containing protein [Ilyomonas limi]|nr:T9SS type A sorting domain-containing protein [Ilyomonas limi]